MTPTAYNIVTDRNFPQKINHEGLASQPPEWCILSNVSQHEQQQQQQQQQQ